MSPYWLIFDFFCVCKSWRRFALFMSSLVAAIKHACMQWCKSLLSIGRDNLQFYPNFALFSTLGGWTSTKTFFRWANYVKTKKKIFTRNGTLFFPEFRWRPKKRKEIVFTRNKTLFLSTDLRSDAHQSQIIEEDADEDHTQIVGEYTVKLLGDISPLVSAPLHVCILRGSRESTGLHLLLQSNTHVCIQRGLRENTPFLLNSSLSTR